MTKKHFIVAARMVNSIRQGEWTDELPPWADLALIDCLTTPYAHAVHTAEAFILLFRQFNPRFDEQRFIWACGLEKAATKGRTHD